MISVFPPSMNHQWRTGNGRVYKAPEVKRFCHDAVYLLKHQPEFQAVHRQGGYTGAVMVRLDFHPDSRRRWDLDNRIKIVLDVLTTAGVWADDSQVRAITAIKHDYDPHHAGVDIQITDMEGAGYGEGYNEAQNG